MVTEPKALTPYRRALPGATLLACVMYSIAGASVAADRSPEGAFLQNLIGSWKGQAVRTPMGPLPYDVAFARGEGGAVAGTADPGAALHHWRFFIADGQLRLRFLSTFRGNARPTWLYAESVTDVSASLRGRDLEYLTVRLERRLTELHVDIFLHAEPHVSIRLALRAPR